MKLRLTLLAAAALLCGGGCASGPRPGTFVWVDDYAEPGRPTEYTIAPGDVIWVRVFGQDGMSARGRVREDGKLSLPFLGDVAAAGYTTGVLAQQLQTRLKDFINAPQVTVSLEEARSFAVPVLGEVAHAGTVPVEAGAGLLQVLAAAGGLSEFAHRDRVFVLRRGPPATRVRVDYEALSRGEGKAATFRLLPGDAVVVE